MFGIGIPEFILILIVGLIVFGPSKLPEIGRAVGKGLREFRKASSALQSAINAQEEPASPRPSGAREAGSAEAGAKPGAPADGQVTASAEEPPQRPAVQGYEPPTQESVRAQLEKKA